MTENNILVTGFGPFGQHKINASWEAVQLLKNYEIEGFKIVTEKIEVTYDYAEKNIPLLWEKYKPKLVVHVGVSHLAKEITLETQAFRYGYLKHDCDNKLHPTGEICCSTSGEDCIAPAINTKDICDNMHDCNLKFCTSTNAGRFLCEFVFYKSLKIDPNRTLFVHVPMLDRPYSADKLAHGIFKVIDGALKQIS